MFVILCTAPLAIIDLGRAGASFFLILARTGLPTITTEEKRSVGMNLTTGLGDVVVGLDSVERKSAVGC